MPIPDHINIIKLNDQEYFNQFYEANSKIKYIALLCNKNIRFYYALLKVNEALTNIINDTEQ